MPFKKELTLHYALMGILVFVLTIFLFVFALLISVVTSAYWKLFVIGLIILAVVVLTFFILVFIGYVSTRDDPDVKKMERKVNQNVD